MYVNLRYNEEMHSPSQMHPQVPCGENTMEYSFLRHYYCFNEIFLNAISRIRSPKMKVFSSNIWLSWMYVGMWNSFSEHGFKIVNSNYLIESVNYIKTSLMYVLLISTKSLFICNTCLQYETILSHDVTNGMMTEILLPIKFTSLFQLITN